MESSLWLCWGIMGCSVMKQKFFAIYSLEMVTISVAIEMAVEISEM